MKGQDLIDYIKDNKLEDFDLKFLFVEGYKGMFPVYRKFKVEAIEDVGYSDKVITLGGEEV